MPGARTGWCLPTCHRRGRQRHGMLFRNASSVSEPPVRWLLDCLNWFALGRLYHKFVGTTDGRYGVSCIAKKGGATVYIRSAIMLEAEVSNNCCVFDLKFSKVVVLTFLLKERTVVYTFGVSTQPYFLTCHGPRLSLPSFLAVSSLFLSFIGLKRKLVGWSAGSRRQGRWCWLDGTWNGGFGDFSFSFF